MDVQRVILIAALALISYVLVLQWNEDYGPAQQQATAELQAPTLSAYSGGAEESELPTAGDAQAPSADVPQHDLTAPQSTVANSQTSDQLISVRTDVLELLIDPHGGDVIRAALPEHDATLNADQPFVLLEQNANRTYIAQSGLIGRNGPDAAPSGRPLYTSEATEYTLGDAPTASLLI